MKRFLLIPSCTLLALSVLTSCQKEEKSALELAQELTAELQKVTDYRTAEASAPRVEALNKRLQDATVRTVAIGGTALLRSDQGDSGAAFADATVKLSREVGRVRSSVPVSSADGDVERELLIMATGVASGVEPGASASARKAAGTKFIMHDADKSHEAPPEFAECYGSDKLKAALDYKADPTESSILKFDSSSDVPAIPEPTPVDEEEPADATEPAADEEPAAAEEDDTPTAAPAPKAAAADEEDDLGSISTDDEADDEPAAADDDEPADDEESEEDELNIDISVDDL